MTKRECTHHVAGCRGRVEVTISSSLIFDTFHSSVTSASSLVQNFVGIIP